MHSKAIHAVRQRFGLQSDAPADPLGLFVYRTDLGLAPLVGWSATSIRRRERPLGSVHTTIWDAPGCTLRIDCREESSRQAAHAALPEALGHVASPEIEPVSPRDLVGETAFATPASVLFQRANLLLGVIVLAGPPESWRQVAKALDEWLCHSPPPSTALAAAAAPATPRLVRPHGSLLLDTAAGEAMVRIFAPGLDIESTAAGVTCSAPSSGTFTYCVARETPSGETAQDHVVQVTD